LYSYVVAGSNKAMMTLQQILQLLGMLIAVCICEAKDKVIGMHLILSLNLQKLSPGSV